MHKPLKGTFTDVINAVADGKGIKQPLQARHAATPKEKAIEPTKHKK